MKQPSVETKIPIKIVRARVLNSDIGQLTDWINALLSTQQAQMREEAIAKYKVELTERIGKMPDFQDTVDLVPKQAVIALINEEKTE